MLQEVFLLAAATLSLAAAQFGQQQGGFRCPQETGQFEAQGDCTSYWQCDGGVASLQQCPLQLIFNPQVGYCDWPLNTPNPGCGAQREPAAAICQQNPYPGNPGQAFHVAHPQACNAFYTCDSGYVYPLCTFCGEGMYFSTESGLCTDYLATGQDVNALCQGRPFIEHRDKVFFQMEQCWPFASQPNPFLPIVNAIRGGGGQRPRLNSFNSLQGFNPSQGFNQGFQNQGFNPMPQQFSSSQFFNPQLG